MSGYQKMIERYGEMHRKADAATILDAWKATDRDMHVYVHSPFCSTLCRFCYYKGVNFDHERDADIYDRFYDDYLPRAIAPFAPLIERSNVKNYFFGGGTPSLMRPDTMRQTFDLFPGMRDVSSKTFEVHPAVYDEKQLDVLAEYGFNCVIIGIQSFDADVLKRQNRLHASPEIVADLVDKIHKRGMHAAADIIFHMDPTDAECIFQQDLDHLAQIPFDVASLQQNYDLRAVDDLTTSFLQMIRESDYFQNNYWSRAQGPSNRLPENADKSTMKCVRCIRNDIPWEQFRHELFPFVGTSDEVSKWSHEKIANPNSRSTLAFGSYKNPRKNTFSNIVSGVECYEYIEVNNEWEPEYYITYHSDKRAEMQQFGEAMAKLRALGEPPAGLTVDKQVGQMVEREDRVDRRRHGRDLMHRLSWTERTDAVEEYLTRLGAAFPEMEILTKDEFEYILL